MIHDQPLIRIRERSFLDLLDLTLLVIRERPITLGLTAAIGILPLTALNLGLLANLGFPRVFWYVLLMMETPWATAPLTLVMGDLMFGRPLSWRHYMKTLAMAFPTMVLTQFLLRGLLLLTVVGTLIVPYRFAFLNEVILLERVRWMSSLSRTKMLGREFDGDLFLRWLAQVFFGGIFALCFWTGTQVIGSAFAGGELTWSQPRTSDLGGFLFHAGVWLAIAFFGVYRFLAYIDRRIRLEGWEVELKLREVGRLLEERET